MGIVDTLQAGGPSCHPTHSIKPWTSSSSKWRFGALHEQNRTWKALQTMERTLFYVRLFVTKTHNIKLRQRQTE